MMTPRTTRAWMAGITALLACAGCGFKGPLYLPERNATVITHPAQKNNKAKTAQPAQAPGSPPASAPPSSPPASS